MIRIIHYREAQSLVARKTQRLEDAERVVAPILEDVRREGDAALLAYARKFDGFEGASVRIPVHGTLEPEFGRAVRIADANIREYARLQLPVEKMVEYPDGRKLGQIVRPLDSMGAYTPAGRYPLPSTLLMNLIPAQVAGVQTTCVACPHPSAEILGIAAWLGVTHFFQMGGAQAIAALAFGTETVPRVDRSVLRSVQTPQGFRHDVLAAAHAAAADAHTDDAGLVEKAGLPVTCVPGSDLALKITRPLDLVLAEALLHVG